MLSIFFAIKTDICTFSSILLRIHDDVLIMVSTDGGIKEHWFQRESYMFPIIE